MTEFNSSTLRCYISVNDAIPVVELYNSGLSFQGELLLFCDRKHVLSYIKNPGSNEPESSSVTQYYTTLQSNFPTFFDKAEDRVFEEFTNAINFLQLEYWAGASFAIRLLGEYLIYNNYGVYAWYKDKQLKSKTNKNEIDYIYDNIRKLGFETFMMIVKSSSVRKNLIEKDDSFNEKRYKLKEGRLNIARSAAENIDEMHSDDLWIEPELLQGIIETFAILSPIVHSREFGDSTKIGFCLEAVLKAYEDYFKKGNQWGVTFEY